MLAVWLIAAAIGITTFILFSPAQARTLAPGVDNLHEALLGRSLTDRMIKPGLRIAGGVLSRLLPQRRINALYELAVTAGVHGFWTRPVIMGARVLSVGLSAFAAWTVWSSRPGVLAFIFGVILVFIGWRLVDTWLVNRARNRQELIVSSLPDYADQIAICVQAGLNLDQAIRRTADSNEGPISDEFHRFLRDVRVGVRRRDAYNALAERVDLADMSSFVRSLSNAEQNGVSIADVLAGQAEELRLQRRQRAEERAMRLPVLMLFPLVTCILPPLFGILLGPVLIELFRSGIR